jgi:c-di-GMP-related signal transduction protein
LIKAACHCLKEAGDLIALDDFGFDDPREPLAELADIIKVEMPRTTFEQAAIMVKPYGPSRSRMLAEKWSLGKNSWPPRTPVPFICRVIFFASPN